MLPSIERPPYLPFVDEQSLLTMGLAPLDTACWIEPDNTLAHYYDNGLRQRELHGDGVYQALPESRAAQRELHGVLLQHLLADHPEHYQLAGDELRLPELGLRWPVAGEQSLWQASQWVQDDICLLQDSAEGYRLVAASLSAASFWRLEDKIGRTLDAIHQPVPGYHEALHGSVERFFRHIKPRHCVWRCNWSVVASNELNQRVEPQRPVAAHTPLFLRVERQTLRRLPATAAVAFTIRVYLHPLQSLQMQPEAWRGLTLALQNLTWRQWHYKSVDKVLPALNGLGLELSTPARA